MAMSALDFSSLDPLAGTPYRAVLRLGGGLTSEVFDATDSQGRRCAVKVLRAAHIDTPEAVLRLQREARALSALDHPSLVRVIDTGLTPDGRPYFVMPRLVGETVRQRLDRGGPMAAARATSLIAGMLEGLDVAHQEGIIHRDLKPANLFLCARGKILGLSPGGRATVNTPPERCVVLDFGIARVAHEHSGKTSAGYILGTPRYFAPEQILGGAIDARTDVYAAGLVLFEMIAGESPFPGSDTRALMSERLEERPRRLSQFAAVSPDLEHAIARALERSPARRWPSARAFAAVLDRAATREREIGGAR